MSFRCAEFETLHSYLGNFVKYQALRSLELRTYVFAYKMYSMEI